MYNKDQIELNIGYKFKDERLLKTAFTHRSFSLNNNERLEFLGDSILNLVVTNRIFDSNLQEGQLTKLRAKIVCEENLAKAIDKLDIAKYEIIGSSFKGEITRAMKCDLCESIIGAIYIDSEKSFDKVIEFIYNHIDFEVKIQEDYKTQLQELVQVSGKNTIKYNTKQLPNTIHAPIFEAELIIDDCSYGARQGTSKRDAEQAIAKYAVEKILLRGVKN